MESSLSYREASHFDWGKEGRGDGEKVELVLDLKLSDSLLYSAPA